MINDRLSSALSVLRKRKCQACNHNVNEHNGYMDLCMHKTNADIGKGMHSGTSGRCECQHIALIRAIHNIPFIESFDYSIYK